MNRRTIKPGELLAIRPDIVQEDRGAFFWLFAPPVPENERIGNVAVVRVNGPLEYHQCAESDSYEAICGRVQEAISGTCGDEDLGPPACVILKIDSPGGVVAGLEQTVNKLRKASKRAGIPLYAYADETAYSAAYALCCACSEVVLPKSGMIGSVGVISTMVDQTKADAKMGLRFVVLTSGTRKADGHPHVAISDAMVKEEAPRVMTLAKHFFAMVKRARGVPMKKVQGFQAARFLGDEATRAGLADDVMSWDRFLATLADIHPPEQAAQSGAHTLAPTGTSVSTSAKGFPMPLSLDALISRTTERLKAEKDPEKLAALGASLSAYKKTKHMIEKHETEEGDEEDEEEEEEEEAEETKGDETDRGDDEDDDSDDDDEEDDDAKKSKAEFPPEKKSKKMKGKKSEESEEEAAAMTSVYKAAVAATGLSGRKAVGALSALLEKASQFDALAARVAKVEATDRRAKRDGLVDVALSQRRITPSQAKSLKSKKLDFVESYLGMHTKAIVNTDADQPIPEMKAGSPIPEHLRKQVADAIASARAQGLKGVTEEKIMENLAKVNGKAPVV